ncbi:uncharacterized protein LOC125757160 [Rhipicephalus sanguineus]|uniref:uncharacterized protein LOC125757160 n=1 Tax=Rhipicephalus sanguineus TaxID=34632 RepID=UPI0020C1E9B1|nr:uncharacterized protein LOC125757160 [Rhipicephalus sanguineus]
MVYCAVVGCKSRTYTKAEKEKAKQNSQNLSNFRCFKIPKVRVHECGKTRQLSQRRQRERIARLNRKGVADNPQKYKGHSLQWVLLALQGLFGSRAALASAPIRRFFHRRRREIHFSDTRPHIQFPDVHRQPRVGAVRARTLLPHAHAVLYVKKQCRDMGARIAVPGHARTVRGNDFTVALAQGP